MKVFAYWDQPENIPAYLQLCLATWHARGGINQICLVTDINLHNWIAEGVLDLEALSEYPIGQRKDAIEIAVLARHGGLFIDVDTIFASPSRAMPEILVDSEIALYGFHLGFVGAQPESPVVYRWLELLQQALTIPRAQLLSVAGPDRFMLGNYCFELLRNELATGRRAVPGERQSRPVKLLQKFQRYRMLRSKGQKFIRQIDPVKSGFIAEAEYRSREKLDARGRYLDFWFDRELPVAAVTGRGASVIGLHHSWTPAAYSALSFEEVAEDSSLLSRFLRLQLGQIDPERPDVFDGLEWVLNNE